MTKQYIFIFSIGPVQSFIAQARKTQDLYGGSRLLSELCKEAITYADRKGIDIIFPKIDLKSNLSNIKSIPNRFVGTFSHTEGVDKSLQEIGENIEEHIQTAFMNMADDVLKLFKISKTIDGFKEQIENHLDINWLFYPIDTNYETDYEHAEQWLGAVKNTRIFNQNPEQGRKCNLDGERNVKFYRPTENDLIKKDTRRNKGWLDILLEDKLFQKQEAVCIKTNTYDIPLSMIQHGEGLSAVSFVKRSFDRDFIFPSTAQIALMHTLNQILANGGEGIKAFVEFRNEFIGNGIEFDEQLYFEENLTKSYFEKFGYEKLVDKLPRIEEKHKIIQKFVKDKKLKFQKYYALIAFDGDNMGKIISGSYLTDKSQLEIFQKRTSELLIKYAKWADTYLDKPKGKTVYAGGDDFLGFVNLENLYDVMQKLYDEFDITVNQKLNNEFVLEDTDKDNNAFKFTFSAGVVIAHYKTPLSIVLNKARAMGKLAKDEGDRDAFALAVLKHSGESHETVFKWNYLDKLKTIHQQLLDENFSNTFIKSIQIELRDFETNFDNLKVGDFVRGKDGEKLALQEIERLVKRSKMPDKSLGKMPEIVKDIFIESKTFKNFAEALNITQFTKRQIKSE